MRRLLIVSALAALITAPTLAEAREACQQRNHERKVTGTLLGAAGGALVGGAIGDGTGAIIGGLGGAAVGHEIGRINCNKPRAEYRPAPRRSATEARYTASSSEPRCFYEDRPFYDDRGRLVNERVRVCRR